MNKREIAVKAACELLNGKQAGIAQTVGYGAGGALVGGSLGALGTYFSDPDKEGEKNWLRNIALGAGAGGLAGVGIGTAFGASDAPVTQPGPVAKSQPTMESGEKKPSTTPPSSRSPEDWDKLHEAESTMSEGDRAAAKWQRDRADYLWLEALKTYNRKMNPPQPSKPLFDQLRDHESWIGKQRADSGVQPNR